MIQYVVGLQAGPVALFTTTNKSIKDKHVRRPELRYFERIEEVGKRDALARLGSIILYYSQLSKRRVPFSYWANPRMRCRYICSTRRQWRWEPNKCRMFGYVCARIVENSNTWILKDFYWNACLMLFVIGTKIFAPCQPGSTGHGGRTNQRSSKGSVVLPSCLGRTLTGCEVSFGSSRCLPART